MYFLFVVLAASLLAPRTIAGPVICTLCNSGHGCCQALFTSGSATCLTTDGVYKITLSAGTPNQFTAVNSGGGNISLFLPNQTVIGPGWEDTTFIQAIASDAHPWTEVVNVTKNDLFCDSEYGCCVLKSTTCNIGSSGKGELYGGYDAQCPATGKSIGFDRTSITGHYVQSCAMKNNNTFWQHWDVSTNRNPWDDIYSFVCR